MNNPKPVIVLTGFLGSGKTTLLNTILSQRKSTRFAIIENEIGEIGIDGSLIVKGEDSFTELSNGCICCSINNNFLDTLRELSKRTDWDELIIEATGVANPGGIISPFKQLPWLEKYYLQPNVICIADAINLKEQLLISETTGSQLAYSDKVYISKTDQVSTEELAEVDKQVKTSSPFARIYKGEKTPELILQLLKKEELLRPVINLGEVAKQIPVDHPHDLFNSISLEYTESFSEYKLFTRLYSFLMLQSSNVYRIKGIFHDPKMAQKMVVQSVMKNLYIDIMEEEWEEGEEKISQFVFIGKNLQEKGFDRMLKGCRV